MDANLNIEKLSEETRFALFLLLFPQYVGTNFSETVRRVFFFARYEMSQKGAKEIGLEELLAGLRREVKKFSE